VGAGLAGLTCAYRLKQQGYSAEVFEASRRIGGRCWTRRGDFDDDQIAEHGGELIDNAHIEIKQLAQELGLKLDNLYRAEKNGTEPLYYFHGAPYTYTEATNDIKQIWQKIHADVTAAGFPTRYDNYTSRGWELDNMSVIDWINENVPGGMDSRLGKLLDVAYNCEYGAESTEQSALNLLFLLGYLGQGNLRIFGPSNEKFHVRGGNDQIPAKMARSLDGQINLEHELVAIRLESDGRYTLTFENGSRTKDVQADKVVLALPFSILRSSVDFSAAGFRGVKETAIREFGMGTNSKMHVQFSDRHWEILGNNGDTIAETGYQQTWEGSRAQSGSAGILVNFTGGNYDNSFGSGTPSSRAEEFCSQIEPVLPGITEKWNGKATIDYWPGYKWTKGSYGCYLTGQYTKFCGIEGEREGNCFFAGEHTSINHQGYLNGAVETGQRAAEEILADLKVTGKAQKRY
ncbi:MAG: flavin monoamine oxidase family protein, partial [Clostridia bacterium]